MNKTYLSMIKMKLKYMFNMKVQQTEVIMLQLKKQKLKFKNLK